MRKSKKELRPLRTVQKSELRATRSIGGGPFGSRSSYWWRLHLDCGHELERRATFTPSGERQGGIRNAKRSAMKDPPKRARCESCPKKEHSK